MHAKRTNERRGNAHSHAGPSKPGPAQSQLYAAVVWATHAPPLTHDDGVHGDTAPDNNLRRHNREQPRFNHCAAVSARADK